MAEHRFPLGPRGVLGGVMFLNGTTTDNPKLNLQLFDSIKAGYGAGLRIMVDKRLRTYLSVDVGFGQKSLTENMFDYNDVKIYYLDGLINTSRLLNYRNLIFRISEMQVLTRACVLNFNQ